LMTASASRLRSLEQPANTSSNTTTNTTNTNPFYNQNSSSAASSPKLMAARVYLGLVCALGHYPLFPSKSSYPTNSTNPTNLTNPTCLPGAATCGQHPSSLRAVFKCAGSIHKRGIGCCSGDNPSNLNNYDIFNNPNNSLISYKLIIK
jgi:hypothetical protein